MSPRRPRVPQVPRSEAPAPTVVSQEDVPTGPLPTVPSASAPRIPPRAVPRRAAELIREAGPAREAGSVREPGPAQVAAPRRAAPARRASARRTAGSRPAPAGRRRPALPEPVPARQVTGRSLIVLVAMLLVAMAVAPTLRNYLNQQLEMAAVREDIVAQQALQQDYEDQLRRWDDPSYVAQQARDRLDLVMPGETLYSVANLPPAEQSAPAEESPVAPVNDRLPWAEGLWDSVVRAGAE
ncbi:septum formation initiator family protein [Micrococcus sp.]|uniref:septum formation initiator family protein n=1 Tax=Micrococcus sp. TaxID=1271 RepID=UPI002A91D68D|nr:septum formation initiator family protein [Micrococcus sp.]MDY6055372.1 septum formation initiator family protein [Micrococcus sp.]